MEIEMQKKANKNYLTFGLGTVGRDMVYTMISMYLIYYMTDIIELPTSTLWGVSGVILLTRIFDAVNDPFMGVIVDNTNTKYGKFKPWIAFGAFTSGIITVFMFADFGLKGVGFIAVFALLYLLWEISFTTNDISYWSLLPSLTMDQKEREKIGAVARICANIGLFAVVAGIVPITNALGEILGSMQKAYFVFSIIIVIIMWIGQCITLFGVKEPKSIHHDNEHTSLRDMVDVIFKNDQLLYTAISMALFMIGYCTTTSFGLYFFKYAYGDEGMYAIFALILGISQILALVIFPMVSKHYDRKTLYRFATILVVLGYIIFFFAPMNTMLYIGIAGVLLFVGQAFIQLLMLVFLADTVEYGQYKMGKRNDSVTFSVQPFINKMGGAIASGIVSVVVIKSGIKDANSALDVTESGLMLMKIAMMILPLIFILLGYIIYNKKYKIDKVMYDNIILELKKRGEIEDK
jgi:sugar (glycoside-pentoside-hexuronide) transporter